MRRAKPLTGLSLNGWNIAKRPNSFGEQYAYEATVVDAAGYRIAKVGFQTMGSAYAYCKRTAAPRERS